MLVLGIFSHTVGCVSLRHYDVGVCGVVGLCTVVERYREYVVGLFGLDLSLVDGMPCARLFLYLSLYVSAVRHSIANAVVHHPCHVVAFSRCAFCGSTLNVGISQLVASVGKALVERCHYRSLVV